jgi:hypothetical protein
LPERGFWLSPDLPTSGVGHDPHPLPSVGRADVASTHQQRPAGVAFAFQVAEHPVSASSSQSRHVLSQHPSGSQHPMTRSISDHSPLRAAVDARALAGDGDVLAGEAAGHKVN